MVDLKERIEEALNSSEPIEELRRIALSLSKRGYNKQEIYDCFFEIYRLLQAGGRTSDEAILGDVMDMIVGWFPSHNLYLD